MQKGTSDDNKPKIVGSTAHDKQLLLETAPAAYEGIASSEESNDKCNKEDVVADVVEDDTHADF